MKEHKAELRFFSIANWKQEQEYLRKQSNSGWRFVNVNALGLYHFEKAEPEDVVYQLDYNPEGLTHKAEYVQMFRDCGWEYLQDYAGYSYFRKPISAMNGDEEIFCDDASRMDFINRVFKGRMLPLLAIFFCLIIPQMFLAAGSAARGVFIVLGVIYLIIFSVFAFQYCKCRKMIK